MAANVTTMLEAILTMASYNHQADPGDWLRGRARTVTLTATVSTAQTELVATLPAARRGQYPDAGRKVGRVATGSGWLR
jgi:hypothetical protein